MNNCCRQQCGRCDAMLRSVVWSTDPSAPVAAVSRERPGRPRRPQRSAAATFVETLAALSACDIVPEQTDSVADPESIAAYQSCPHHLRVDSALPAGRRERKRVQLNFMIHHMRVLLQFRSSTEQTRVVEFCSGSGHICLPLAYLYPSVSFVMIDRNPRAIEIGHARVAAARAAAGDSNLLSNVRAIVADISAYEEPFHLGVSLHACGAASDIVISKCLSAGAAFVVCPCCIGKIAQCRRSFMSRTMQAAMSCERRFLDLIRAADFGHGKESSEPLSAKEAQRCAARLRCKAFVEEDRRLLAQEQGYSRVRVTRMPRGASVKCDVIIGVR